ncbi:MULTISPECIES: transcriptional regulator [Citrobacter]|uniref:DNA-binding transcriptional activator CadC n=4 Tax=Citrobacter freundii complex TaxID=1344959 RepID=A0A9N8GUK1_9ENTR|nr:MULTISPECIES: winged helix-turn-helix domain-containing protein [Citrobacter]AHY12024.1 CadC family transcriptional regulator [Citrobacter freundii CFNIH1]AWS98250.1 CadC family transcriptional regulator [Citrobacter sp. CRE-46]KAA0558348.1 CadC family transcriptional regulator [Citrobacter werkmanii]MBD0818367.1 winged helix-turn-helix domain-containing protein [Citrobacter sp. C5_2]MBJ8388216.1 winged helix-turn-helix domain-containing protein [Citrobacter cronae]
MSIVVNNWRMDSSLNALIHCETGEIRRLGEYHFILLETLAKNADVVLSRSYLMSAVWKNRIVGGNSLPTAVHALRVAIDDDGKQQEIIKTIPKKGYLFNKNYLTETIDLNEAVADDSTIDEVEKRTEIIESPALDEMRSSTNHGEIPLLNSQLSSRNQRKTAIRRHPYRAVLITLPVIVIALSLFILISYFKAPSVTKMEEAPQLVKETLENANHVTVYQLYDPGENKKSSSLVSTHILPGIEQLNPLLVSHNASMTLYYRVSLNKLALDIVLSNQCNDKWQLALSFDNWLNKDNEMNGILIKEVEKMLNEMPKCK